jgi:hypothetical protein
VVAMATAAFERGAPTMADMGYDARELDALVRRAGNAVLAAAPPPPPAFEHAADDTVERPEIIGDAPTYRGDPDGREYDESVEDEVDCLSCPHCGGKVPRG